MNESSDVDSDMLESLKGVFDEAVHCAGTGRTRKRHVTVRVELRKGHKVPGKRWECRMLC